MLSLTGTPSLIRSWREEDNNYEAEEVEEENPATRKAFARGSTEAGEAQTQIAAGGVGAGVESCEEIGCPSHISPEEVSSANSRNEETEHRKESEEKIESFTGTSCATCCRDESQVGCEEGGRGE